MQKDIVGTTLIELCGVLAYTASVPIYFNLNHFDAADKTVIALILFKRAPNSREIHSCSYGPSLSCVYILATRRETLWSPHRAP